jgi:four helix bundle protein
MFGQGFDSPRLHHKKAKEFHLESLNLLDTIKTTSYKKDQLGRASMSIVLNIAEGSGKFSKPDRRSFYVIARASVFECVAIFDLLKDKNKSSQKEFESMLHLADEISRMLYKMICNLSNPQSA